MNAFTIVTTIVALLLGLLAVLVVGPKNIVRSLKDWSDTILSRAGSEIRIRIKELNEANGQETIPTFFDECTVTKEPLGSIVLRMEVEFLNRSQSPIVIDNAMLTIKSAEDCVTTEELYTMGLIPTRHGGIGLQNLVSMPFRLNPSEPISKTAAFRLRSYLPSDLNYCACTLTLIDSDKVKHTSDTFMAYNYPGYPLSKKVIELLYKRRSNRISA